MSSKEKGGSGAHDHSRHKITIHSKFPRHKITLKNQQFYLSIFYSSPSTKHATRHNFQLNHSNSCKLHQNDPQHTKMIPQVDSSAHQTPSIYISLSAPHINTQHVIGFHLYTKGGSGASGFQRTINTIYPRMGFWRTFTTPLARISIKKFCQNSTLPTVIFFLLGGCRAGVDWVSSRCRPGVDLKLKLKNYMYPVLDLV